MNNLRVEAVKLSCAFNLKLESPVKTLERICALLTSRSIQINLLQMQDATGTEAMLIIHCQVDKDRVTYFIACLEKMEGVVELEWLEAKGRNKQYGR